MEITSVSGRYIILEWAPVPRLDILYYEIEAKEVSNNIILKEKSFKTPLTVTNLKPETTYTLKIRTVALHDRLSEWKTLEQFTTTSKYKKQQI